MPVRSLGYHEIVEGPSDSFYSLSAEQFEWQLETLSELNTEDSCSIEITFDDGHLSNAQIAAPLLQKTHRSATFFVTASWIGMRSGFMKWSQLSDLVQQGHKVQSHGLTHRFLTNLSEAEIATELRDSKSMLEDRLGLEISEVSLPGGRYNRRVLEMCENIGYRRVYTSAPWNSSTLSVYTELRGRLIVNRRMTKEWLGRYLRGELSPHLLVCAGHMFREAAKMALGDSFYHRIWSVLARRRGMKANAR